MTVIKYLLNQLWSVFGFSRWRGENRDIIYLFIHLLKRRVNEGLRDVSMWKNLLQAWSASNVKILRRLWWKRIITGNSAHMEMVSDRVVCPQTSSSIQQNYYRFPLESMKILLPQRIVILHENVNFVWKGVFFQWYLQTSSFQKSFT